MAPKETPKTGQVVVRVRKVKLTSDPAENVKKVGTHRLNAALRAIDALAKCSGPNYKWTKEQIQAVEDHLAKHCLACIEGLGQEHRVTVNTVTL